MATELDLKKVELKVFINCCDGCKRKTKKVLRSIEGVLKTEIDPLQPRVTVLGNVDPQILIKKLSKAGKQAELWKQLGNEKAANANKQVANKTNEKKKSESGYNKLAKCPDSSCDNDSGSGSGSSSTEKVVVKKIPNSGDIRGPEHDQDQTEIGGGAVYEVTNNQNAILPTNHEDLARRMVHDTMKVSTCIQQCCMVEPPQTITLPYYAIHSYAAAAAPFSSMCYTQANYHNEMAVYQPPFQAPATQVGDYFSDENSVGCSVM